MKADEIRLGFIGLGRRAFQLRFAHKPEEHVRIIAGADPRPEAQSKFREWMHSWFKTDVEALSDYRGLLSRKDIDAVFITSSDYLHEEHAVAALQAGKAVYVEKPMGTTLAGCDHMLKVAAVTGNLLFVGHNMRHSLFVLKMKELIDAGAIGEPKVAWCRHFVGYGGDAYFKDWHAEREKSMGLLLQKGVHDIDVMHWLCNSASCRVVGMGGLTLYDKVADRHAPGVWPIVEWKDGNWPPLSQKGLNPVIDVEDVSMMLMQLRNGVFASYQQCHFTPDQVRNYAIIGTEGRIENLGEDMIALWDKRVSAYQLTGLKQIPVPAAEGGHGGADPAILGEFIACMRTGAKPRTSPIAARDAVGAAYLATMSLRDGSHPMDLPPVPPEIAARF